MTNRNPAADPFTPGSGHPPPYLAGRDRETAELTNTLIPRLQAGRPTRPVLFTGIRGIGKTSLLTVARRAAVDNGLPIIRLEASRRSALLDDLVSQLEELLTRLETRRAVTRSALRTLEEFKLSLRVAGTGVEVAGRRTPAITASSERLARQLLTAVASAAAESGSSALLVVDELQQGVPELLGPLLTAIHEINQDEIPFATVAAGLPHTDDWVAQHVAYGGRMFTHHALDLFDRDTTRATYIHTIELIPNESFTDQALDELTAASQGLPYFVQEHGSATWRHANDDPIGLTDVKRALPHSQRAIDAFYQQRLTEASSRERDYLIAIAHLDHEGPYRTSDIAAQLNVEPANVATYRRRLIRDKGLLTEPARGLVDFALPGMNHWLRQHHTDT